MELSFRWYGPKDSVKLSEIRQSNAEYIVTSLHQIPTGYKWNKDDVIKRINLIKSNNNKTNVNLKWNVVESIPVHNNIKLRKDNFRKLIDNYKDSIVSIADNNIKTICYNFMPIIDWTRTQLDYKLPTDGLALRFSFIQFIIFEKYILNLKDLEKRYTDKQLKLAEKNFKKLKNSDIENLKLSIMGGLPAAEKKYTIKEFKKMLDAYSNVNEDELRSNLKEFLSAILPIADDKKIKMAIHPDDPPIPLFGLPRIVSNMEDFSYIFNSYKSDSNGMTFCAGSLASSFKNNVYEIFKKFKKKVNFIHLRNVYIEKDKKSFYETNHLKGDVDFVKLIKLILEEENRRKKLNFKNYNIPMRPDHGHCLLDDQRKKFNPGYSVIGRMMGLSELRGIIKSLQ